jgi:glucose-6-phosphate 1-dehydrogenase
MSRRRYERPPNHVIVLYGATGDLAKRKILPGLFHLSSVGLMPERYRIVGVSRGELSDDEMRATSLLALQMFGPKRVRASDRMNFCHRIFGANHDEVPEAVARAEREIGGRPRRLFHLAVPPSAFESVVQQLAAEGLSRRARVVVEKPFGWDLASARELNNVLHSAFPERDVFRMDHFLGKESVENILALRFANGFFEPVWNRDHIDHIQIDVPETLSIAGRAGFYEGTGAFRDMVVTHLFQVLGFVAMEPPTALEAKALRVEKNKVFEAMQPLDPSRVVRGQYEGYRDEPGVVKSSKTETLVALEVQVDNWRWAGVPFFLRTGKCMAESRQTVSLAFREPPLRMFRLARGQQASQRPNELQIEFRDPGSISQRFLTKQPGPGIELNEAAMTFSYDDSLASGLLEAYERLLYDAMMGDQMLFTDAAGIERLWRLSMPLLEQLPRLHRYPEGSWGPASARELIAPRRWCLPEAG